MEVNERDPTARRDKQRSSNSGHLVTPDSKNVVRIRQLNRQRRPLTS